MMNGISAKTKLILVVSGFLLFLLLMMFFGYGIMGGRNVGLADELTQKRIELDVLQREQTAFEQGKKDLAKLEQAQYPPEDLFSRDTKVVKEIQQLEAAANLYNLKLDIAISGTTSTAEKVKDITGDIYTIPYTLTLEGSFANQALFLQAMEHLPFVTHAKAANITVGPEDKSKMVITSEFYIKK